MILDQRKQLQVQSAKAKVPLTGVAIGAFEISTAHLGRWRNVPASTALISYEWKPIVIGNLLHELGIILNGLKAIGDGEC